MFKYIIDVVYVSFNVVYVLFIHCLYDIYIYIIWKLTLLPVKIESIKLFQR